MTCRDPPHLKFNETTSLGFYCAFPNNYLSITMYKWTVNGQDEGSSQHLEYPFEKGIHKVMCESWYEIGLPDCECRKEACVMVTVEGTKYTQFLTSADELTQRFQIGVVS